MRKNKDDAATRKRRERCIAMKRWWVVSAIPISVIILILFNSTWMVSCFPPSPDGLLLVVFPRRIHSQFILRG